MGFVNVYVKNIANLGKEDLPWICERISPARRRVLEHRKSAKDQIRCGVAEMLLWTGLAGIGEDIREYGVHYEANEKPYLLMEGDEPCKGLDFSFSHSGDYVVCAISDAPIGVDVQEVTKRKPILSGHIFSEAEMDRVSKNEPLFWDYWTCKEAFIKCAAIEKPSLRTAELDLGKIPHPIINRKDKKEFYFHTEAIDSLHTLSICVRTTKRCSLSFLPFDT